MSQVEDISPVEQHTTLEVPSSDFKGCIYVPVAVQAGSTPVAFPDAIDHSSLVLDLFDEVHADHQFVELIYQLEVVTAGIESIEWWVDFDSNLLVGKFELYQIVSVDGSRVRLAADPLGNNKLKVSGVKVISHTSAAQSLPIRIAFKVLADQDERISLMPQHGLHLKVVKQSAAAESRWVGDVVNGIPPDVIIR
ncbi:hypothetical protein [Ferrimonas pelagia]|uniref:Cohesin domain-containing protein n=1 Tax=Ferrimonas pelagia TaxID=1177826 RepID=A0ABP9ELB7_9GAMM